MRLVAAADLARADLGRLLRDDATGWAAVLSQPNATERPDPTDLVAAGVRLPRARRAPRLRRTAGPHARRRTSRPSPTGTRTSPRSRGATTVQDPAVVGPELVAAAEAVAARYDAILDAPEETWARRGLRDNGSEFTVDSIARYHLHDVLHHSHDVRGTAARATVRGLRRRRDAVQRRHLGPERRGQRGARLARRRRRTRRVGARDRQRGGPRRDRARGAGTDRAAYGRHARLRRADAQPGLRCRAARPADGRAG